MESVDSQMVIEETKKQRGLLVVDSDKVLNQMDNNTKKLFTKETGNEKSDEQRTDLFLKDLVEGITNIINLSRQEDYDTIFFLDKSARPLEHLFSSTWNKAFPGEKKPQLRFFNNFSKSELSEGKYTTSLLEEFKKTFSKDIINKRILVVDEYVSSGHSLGVAQEIIYRSVGKKSPDVTFTGVLKHSWVSWRVQESTKVKEDTPKKGVGVIDKGLPVVLHSDNGMEAKLDTTGHRSFISEPLVKKVREAGDENLANKLQEQVNSLRVGLDIIAELIAKNTKVSSPGEFVVKPYLPNHNFETSFNGDRN